MNERFRERLRALASGAASERPDVEALQRQGRRYRLARRAATGVSALVVCLALVLPIYALSGLSGGHRAGDEPSVSESAAPSESLTATPTPSNTSDPSETSTPSEEVPDVLHVTCAPDGMTLASTKVRAQADGVHVQIDHQGASGDGWSAALLTRDVGRFDTFGLGSAVYTFPPGIIYSRCGSIPSSPSEAGVREFHVLDPDGYWVTDELACSSFVDARGFDQWGQAATPEQVLREHVPGVLPSDDVIPAEYGVRDDYAWMLVRRDGQTLARFQVVAEPERDSWMLHFGETCRASGFDER